jgi:transcriptional regulator with AAA-type ATPase domain
MSEIKYFPIDIALYFKWGDFSLSDQNSILHDIWTEKKGLLAYDFGDNILKFKRRIQDASYFLEDSGFDDEYQDIVYILRDTDYRYSLEHLEDEYSAVESAFKLIKLQLTYTENVFYIRRKLRKFLANLGYQRRSPQLVQRMKKACRELGLVPYGPGKVKCDLGHINIDEWISFRLK